MHYSLLHFREIIIDLTSLFDMNSNSNAMYDCRMVYTAICLCNICICIHMMESTFGVAKKIN